jgi:cell division protein FtsN
MKSIYLSGFLTICILFTMNACKSRESAYKAAYEAAKEKEMQAEDATTAKKPDVSPSAASAIVQKERVLAVENTTSAILRYNVVVGSFTNQTNALSLKERMIDRGYSAFVARNKKGMYRVIAATFSDKTSAAVEREDIKKKYYPEFQDAWILDGH